jgi:hypothetical protein
MQEAIVFFFLVSPIFYGLGVLTDWAHEHIGELPRSFGWILLVTALVLFALAPLSGAVLGIAQGLFWLRVSRRQDAAKQARPQ